MSALFQHRVARDFLSIAEMEQTMSVSLAQAYINLSQRLPISDISVQRRLDRAYDIFISHGYTIIGAGDTWTVSRASTNLLEDNSATYRVTANSCTCPDGSEGGAARAGLCKHVLAVMLVKEINNG